MAISSNSLPEDVHHSGDDIIVDLHTSLAVSTANLRLELDLQIEETLDSGTVTTLVKFTLHVDDNGDAKFHIGQYLADYFNSLRAHELPALTLAAATEAQNIRRRYKIRGNELSGDPQTQTDSNQWTDFYTVIHGGLSREQQAQAIYFGSGNLHETLNEPFMDFQGGQVRTRLDQRQILGWYNSWNFGAAHTFRLYVQIWFADGTNDTINPIADFNADDNEVWLLPAGFEAMDIETQEVGMGSKALYYEVYIRSTTQAGSHSERKRFVIDREYYRQVNFLWFTNALGVPQCMAIRGKHISTMNSSAQDAGIYWDADSDVEDGDSIRFGTELVTGLKLSTGWQKTLNERAQVEQLLASDRVWIEQGEGNAAVRIPVAISNGELETDEEGRRWRAELVMNKRFVNERMTRVPQ